VTPVGVLAERFISRLQKSGLSVQSGAAAEQIRRFEVANAVQLPLDLVEFLSCVDGMKEGEIDFENHIRILSLGELQPLVDQLPEYAATVLDATHAYVFADFLLWSLAYVIWLTPHRVDRTPVYLVGDGPPICVAASFAGFLELYVDNSPDLIPRK
jgi:hypothetical protein